MKKTLIVTGNFPPDFTGAGLRALRLCQRLNKKYGVKFNVLCVKNTSDYEDDKQDISNINITRIAPAKGKRLFLPYYLIRTIAKVNPYLKENKDEIGVIHFFSFSWMSRMIMLLNTLLYKKKSILEVTLYGDDDPLSLMNKGMRNKLFKYLTKSLLLRINQFIVPSEDALNSCLKAGIDRDKIWYRPHPVDDNIFASIDFKEKKRLRKKLNLPDKFIMINIGMIYQRKNQLFLVKCLKRLVESGKKKSILVLIGPKENESQEYLNKINEFVSTSSLKKNVIILDPQKNINEFLIASDMLVFASSSEGFPNVVAESMVSGLPTVTLELGCINPFISKKNGIIIDRYNKSEDEVEKQFTNALSKVYSGKIKYDRREVRKQGLKLFSSTKADKEYYQIYSEIKNR